MTLIAVEQVAGRDLPQLRLTPGLMQPRLVSRAAGGRAHVAIVAGGAALLGGDTVSLGIRVGTGCSLLIEDVGGTVAYPCRDVDSRWDVDIDVAEGASLVWETFPFVVTSAARVRRSTRVRFGAGATVCLRETLVLGRSGEHGGAITGATEVRDTTGAPYFVEELAIDGSAPEPGVMGAASVLDTAMLFGRRSDTEAHGDTDGHGRILHLARPGAIARASGTHTHDAHVDAVWEVWTKATTTGDDSTVSGRRVPQTTPAQHTDPAMTDDTSPVTTNDSAQR